MHHHPVPDAHKCPAPAKTGIEKEEALLPLIFY
jgi:hypothetical protein